MRKLSLESWKTQGRGQLIVRTDKISQVFREDKVENHVFSKPHRHAIVNSA